MEIRTSKMNGRRDTYDKMDEDSKKRILGDTIKWRRGQVLGAGSFGVVNLGMVVSTGEFVAVKELDLSNFSEGREEFTQSVMKEGNLLKSLEHTNVVKYKGVDLVDEKLYLYMEFVPGGSISQLLEEFGAFDEKTIQTYTRQILNGLIFLHSQNVTHSDIKGANILISDKGDVKLCDFGLSSHGPTSYCSGTVPWMAPEAIKNAATLESDIWSLGCTIIEMATRKAPWAECQFDCVEAYVFALAVGDALPKMPEGLSDPCLDFLSLCFKRNPAERATAEQLSHHPWMMQRKPPMSNSKPKSGMRRMTQVPTIEESKSCVTLSAIKEYLSSVQGAHKKTMDELQGKRPQTAPEANLERHSSSSSGFLPALERDGSFYESSSASEGLCELTPCNSDLSNYAESFTGTSNPPEEGHSDTLHTIHDLLSKCGRVAGVPLEVQTLIDRSLRLVTKTLDAPALQIQEATRSAIAPRFNTERPLPAPAFRVNHQGMKISPRRTLPPLRTGA